MRLALALSLLALLLRPAPLRADELLIDGISAQVGADIVLVSEVMGLVAPQERAMREKQAPEHHIVHSRADAIENMIDLRLIDQMV